MLPTEYRLAVGPLVFPWGRKKLRKSAAVFEKRDQGDEGVSLRGA